jgi:hypothetical protein
MKEIISFIVSLDRKKIDLLDKEALGELNEEFLMIDDKKINQNISISIEYNETGLTEISEAKRMVDLVIINL